MTFDISPKKRMFELTKLL